MKPENMTATTYNWVPSQKLYNGDNYALLLSQKTVYTTTQQFAISGGLANPSAPSSSPSAPQSSQPSQTSQPSQASQPSSNSGSLPTLEPQVGNHPGGTNTTEILGVDRKALGKDTAAGIIAGLIGIFAALFCLLVFSIATKKLAAMPPPGGKEPDTEANMSQAQDYRSATPIAGARDDYYKGKDMRSDGSFELASTNSSRSDSVDDNASSSSQKYSPALGSPETLVDTPKNRAIDPYMGLDAIIDEEPPTPVWHMEQPRTAYASSTAIPAVPTVTTLPAQTYQQPSMRRKDLAPAAMLPQYTGDTAVGGLNGFNDGTRPVQPLRTASRLYAESQYRNMGGRLSPTEEDFQGRFRSS